MVGYEMLAQEQRDLTPEQVSSTPQPARLVHTSCTRLLTAAAAAAVLCLLEGC